MVVTGDVVSSTYVVQVRLLNEDDAFTNWYDDSRDHDLQSAFAYVELRQHQAGREYRVVNRVDREVVGR